MEDSKKQTQRERKQWQMSLSCSWVIMADNDDKFLKIEKNYRQECMGMNSVDDG